MNERSLVVYCINLRSKEDISDKLFFTGPSSLKREEIQGIINSSIGDYSTKTDLVENVTRNLEEKLGMIRLEDIHITSSNVYEISYF